jgi:hypothetical protein
MIKSFRITAAACSLALLFSCTAFAGTFEDNGAGDTVYRNDNGTLQNSGWFQDGGKWYYADTDGKIIKGTVTPDGYLTDIFGAWAESQYDYLVGSYSLISEKKADAENYTEPASADGTTLTLSLKQTADGLMNLTETWSYPNGAVLRTWSEDFYPIRNGTFYQNYYTEKYDNTNIHTDVVKRSNLSVMTDNANGQITLSCPDGKDGKGTWNGIFRKN